MIPATIAGTSRRRSTVSAAATQPRRILRERHEQRDESLHVARRSQDVVQMRFDAPRPSLDRSSATSAAPEITAIGVRSSWLAMLTNARSRTTNSSIRCR